MTGARQKKTYPPNAMNGGNGTLTSMLDLNTIVKCQTVIGQYQRWAAPGHSGIQAGREGQVKSSICKD